MNVSREYAKANTISARTVAQLVGLTHRQGVSEYRKRYPDFPAPLLDEGRCKWWWKPDVTRWVQRRNRR